MLFPLTVIFIFLYVIGQNTKYLISIADTDDLVLLHEGISNYRVEYAPMHFKLFIG